MEISSNHSYTFVTATSAAPCLGEKNEQKSGKRTMKTRQPQQTNGRKQQSGMAFNLYKYRLWGEGERENKTWYPADASSHDTTSRNVRV